MPSLREGRIPTLRNFLEAQRRLKAELKDNVTATPKSGKQFAASIGISVAQLDFCVSARRHVLPGIENMAISSHGLGLPPEYTADCKFFMR